MKRKSIIIIVILVITSLVGFSIFQINNESQNSIFHPKRNPNLSDNGIIQLLKDIHPELKDYPSDGLPPKSIKSEFKDDVWYIGFLQEGSGVPIISARCFSVDSDNVIIEKEFVAATRLSDTSFSPQICTTINYNY
jgi:hypothetical protein